MPLLRWVAVRTDRGTPLVEVRA